MVAAEKCLASKQPITVVTLQRLKTPVLEGKPAPAQRTLVVALEKLKTPVTGAKPVPTQPMVVVALQILNSLVWDIQPVDLQLTMEPLERLKTPVLESTLVAVLHLITPLNLACRVVATSQVPANMSRKRPSRPHAAPSLERARNPGAARERRGIPILTLRKLAVWPTNHVEDVLLMTRMRSLVVLGTYTLPHV